MLQPNHIALFFTVVLLAVTAYFLLGSVPLLVLKLDTPDDSRFIRSFYMTYFRIAFLTAVAAAVSYAVSARPVFAVGPAIIAALTLLLRSKFVPQMDSLGAQIQAQDADAIPAFRKIHKSAILINLTQLAAILGSLGSF